MSQSAKHASGQPGQPVTYTKCLQYGKGCRDHKGQAQGGEQGTHRATPQQGSQRIVEGDLARENKLGGKHAGGYQAKSDPYRMQAGIRPDDNQDPDKTAEIGRASCRERV